MNPETALEVITAAANLLIGSLGQALAVGQAAVKENVELKERLKELEPKQNTD